MPDTNEPTQSNKDKVIAGVKKTAGVADKVSSTAEVANNAFSMIKWVAIAVTALAVLALGWGGYKMITKPVAVVTDAAGAVVETVSDSAGAIKDGAAGALNRLQIQSADQRALSRAAETAFPILFNMAETKADGMKERMFRSTNFGGSNGSVCKFSQDFGGGALSVFAAADIDDHKTAASLGSKDDRLIRMVIRAEDDDIMFNTQWDETQGWTMRWKRTTVIKPLSDPLAEARLLDILTAVPKHCAK